MGEAFKLRLSNKDIVEIAEDFLKKVDPGLFKYPRMTNLERLVESIKHQYGFEFSIQNLGSRDNKKILGQTNFKLKAILIDESFHDEECGRFLRYPFVLAHEMGHCIIHGPHYESLKEAGVFGESTTDDRDSIFSKKTLITERDFIEHQASHFAGAILVPSASLPTAIRNVQSKLGINRGLGKIYLDHNDYSIRDMNLTLTELQSIYFVSKSVLKVRLEQDGLIEKPSIRDKQIDAIIERYFSITRLDE